MIKFKPNRLSRNQFEALIQGTWRESANGDRRTNGTFTTFIMRRPNEPKYKAITNGQQTIRAKTWGELALAIKDVTGKRNG